MKLSQLNESTRKDTTAVDNVIAANAKNTAIKHLKLAADSEPDSDDYHYHMAHHYYSMKTHFENDGNIDTAQFYNRSSLHHQTKA